MTERDRDSLTRWQGRTLDQFSFLTNLLLGLSTAGVGFGASALLEQKVPASGLGRWLFITAVGCQAAAMVAGVGLAWNRVLDFRKTKDTVKARGISLTQAKDLRKQSRELGEGSWRILLAQTILFVVGALALIAFTVSRS